MKGNGGGLRPASLTMDCEESLELDHDEGGHASTVQGGFMTYYA